MRALVVYESMFGNTHQVADAIGAGLGLTPDRVVPVTQVTREMVDEADLVVVGGPTHVHGMARESTRKAAVEQAGEAERGLTLDPSATDESGLREWLQSLGRLTVKGAAFDTRVAVPVVLSGRAAKGIAAALRRHGIDLVVPPESFLVDKANHLVDGELERARAWGAGLASCCRRVPTA